MALGKTLRLCVIGIGLAMTMALATIVGADSVKVVDAWLHPYEVGSSMIVVDGQNQAALDFVVPAGQRAVVEFVSIELSLQEGNSAYCTLLADDNTTAYVAQQQHALVLFPQGTDGVRPGQVVLHASQPIRMTAVHSTDPAVKDLRIFCTFAQPSVPATPIIFRGNVSGFLLKLP